MHGKYFITVSNGASLYAYGPFDTLDEAEKWKEKHSNAFAGRDVHVLCDHNTYLPDDTA